MLQLITDAKTQRSYHTSDYETALFFANLFQGRYYFVGLNDWIIFI